jgi:hypothetical protein
MSHRPTLHPDTIDQQTPTKHVEPGVTVSHEDLLGVVAAITTPTGGLHSSKPVTNVPAGYN